MAVLCVLLMAACVYDYRRNRIPNYLMIITAVLGAGWCFRNAGFLGILQYGGKAVLIMALLYPIFQIGAVGAGDVKILGVTAGYLPFGKILSFLFASLLAAAIISLLKMWKNQCFVERMQYLAGYFAEALQNGGRKLYLEKEEDKRRVGICLSGPVLFGILLYMGGIY